MTDCSGACATCHTYLRAGGLEDVQPVLAEALEPWERLRQPVHRKKLEASCCVDRKDVEGLP